MCVIVCICVMYPYFYDKCMCMYVCSVAVYSRLSCHFLHYVRLEESAEATLQYQQQHQQQQQQQQQSATTANTPVVSCVILTKF